MSEKEQQSPLGARKRKEKFSEEELRVLTTEVTQHEMELFGKASANVSYATKEAIWSSIVEKVNAVGVTRRTVNQVIKRWQDLRRRTKEKLARQHRHAAGTGGGLPSTSQLTTGEDNPSTTESHVEDPQETREEAHPNRVEEEDVENIECPEEAKTFSINLEQMPSQFAARHIPETQSCRESTITAVERDLLAAQQQQCRLMAESNSIQRRLVGEVSRNYRCLNDLASSIRAQMALTASTQDRMVQVLDRQEQTYHLLALQITGSSSAPSMSSEVTGGSAVPSTSSTPARGRALKRGGCGRPAAELSPPAKLRGDK
ncbi:UNVERIFIED_CONTAM: hypothetical protein FKN15_053989 [Acipenser sinensis]